MEEKEEEEESISQADYSIAGAGLFLQLLQTLIHHKTTRYITHK